MKAVFTEKYVQQLVPEGKAYVVWDAEVVGFGVRVTPTGRKVFMLQARFNNKQRKLTLGYYPLMNVREARTAFLNKRDRILNGPEVGYGKPHTPRFDAFVNGVWMEQKLSQLKPGGRRTTLGYIRSRLLPAFGQMYLDEIHKPVVARWFDDYSKTCPGGANRALEILIPILEFAIVCGHMEDNPAKGIRKNPKKVLNRFLSAREIKTVSRLLHKAGKESRDYKQAADIARLLLLTGCRHREITWLEWSMIKGDTIRLPDTKTGPREVYPGKQAVAIVERQRGNRTQWVFPLIGTPALPRDNINAFWRDIRQRAGLEDVRVHDLRHTFASHAIIKGVTVPMVSELLGHRKTSMTLRYTHVSDQDTEAAAERIGATLRDLLRGKTPESKTGRAAKEPSKPDGSPKKRILIPGKLRGKAQAEVLEDISTKRRIKSACFTVRLSEAEHAIIIARAKAGGKSISTWARARLDNPPERLPMPNTRQQVRTKSVSLRVTREQAAQYNKAAEAAGHTVSWWARLAWLGYPFP